MRRARRSSARASGRRRSTIGILLIALTAWTPVLRADDVIDRVLAVVGGEMITLTDVTAARDLGLVSAGDAPDPVRAILSQLIDRELVLAEVDRYAPQEPDAASVDRALQAVRDRFSSDEAFQTVLRRSGIDQQHVRETLRQDLRIDAYLDQRFGAPAFTDDELASYYREHPQTFTRNGALLPFDAARPDVARAASTDRRKALVADWVNGLRRRADIIDLYLAGDPVG